MCWCVLYTLLTAYHSHGGATHCSLRSLHFLTCSFSVNSWSYIHIPQLCLFLISLLAADWSMQPVYLHCVTNLSVITISASLQPSLLSDHNTVSEAALLHTPLSWATLAASMCGLYTATQSFYSFTTFCKCNLILWLEALDLNGFLKQYSATLNQILLNSQFQCYHHWY